MATVKRFIPTKMVPQNYTTCNAFIASSTQVSIVAGNGFTVKVTPAPTTYRYRFSYRVVN